jgi:hypothetical protein
MHKEFIFILILLKINITNISSFIAYLQFRLQFKHFVLDLIKFFLNIVASLLETLIPVPISENATLDRTLNRLIETIDVLLDTADTSINLFPQFRPELIDILECVLDPERHLLLETLGELAVEVLLVLIT